MQDDDNYRDNNGYENGEVGFDAHLCAFAIYDLMYRNFFGLV